MKFPWKWPVGENSFAFVLNPFHYEGTLPIDLLPGAYLDHATPGQVELIKELREKSGRPGREMAFDREPIPEHVRKSPDWDRKLWPRTTFWTINFKIDAEEVISFRRASQLTDNELEIGAIFPPQDQVFLPRVEYPWIIESYFDMAWQNDAQVLNLEDLARTRELMERIRAFRADEKDPAKSLIVRIFDDFVQLSAQHEVSHLRLLGHFALIEALITHEPANSAQRLSHQVRTKMPLLIRRFSRALAPGDFFAIDDQRETWSILYRLRSCYAHGERPDFDSAERSRGVKQLRAIRNAFQFVREALKRLIILSLEEPQLVFDLKAC